MFHALLYIYTFMDKRSDIILGPRSMRGTQRMHVVTVVANRVVQYGVRCEWINCRGAGELSATVLDHGFIGRTLRNQTQLSGGNSISNVGTRTFPEPHIDHWWLHYSIYAR